MKCKKIQKDFQVFFYIILQLRTYLTISKHIYTHISLTKKSPAEAGFLINLTYIIVWF